MTHLDHPSMPARNASPGTTSSAGGHHRRPIAGGFTLIELLVVVGIIAVLMAILLPALGRARQEVFKITCASNLRQWGTSMNAFAGDRNNRIPGEHTEQFAHLLTHLTFNDHRTNEMVGFLSEYLVDQDIDSIVAGDHGVLHCPLDQWGRRDEGDNRRLIGYFYLPRRESGQMDFTPAGAGWVTKTRFDGPYSAAPTMMDTWFSQNGSLIWPGGSEVPEGTSLASHTSPNDPESPMGSNFLSEDASVQWFNAAEVRVGAREGAREKYYRIPVPGLVSGEN